MAIKSYFNRVILLVILVLPPLVFAQPGPIKMLRYDDDFKYLKANSVTKKGIDKLKFIPFSKTADVTISFGGELREWFEYRKNPNFGDLPPGQVEDPNGVLQHRLMLHTNVEFGNRLRVFAQLNSTFESGNPNPVIPEILVDGLGLHQLFVDIQTGKTEGPTKDVFRLGRQEYSFGNELLVSSREGPNNRLAFDGITFIREKSRYNLNVFAATPVIINPRVFDNTHTEEALWGAYTNFKKHKKNKLDLYYLGFYSERRQFNYVPGVQRRHTFGARLWNHGKSFFYDVETMYQTGKFNEFTINAANFTGEIRYVFQETFWKPMIGLGASYITGDRDSNDVQLNTYDPLYPKPVYGLATPLGPSNIAHIKPTFGIQPLDKLYFNFNWYLLSRTSTQDGTYTPSMVQVRPIPPLSSDKYRVGSQYTLDAFYFINKNLSFTTFLSYVRPGAYIQETGTGKNVFFWASMLQFKF